MSALLIAHVMALSLWGGIVATEAVLEMANRKDPATRGFVARTHYWIDLLIEVPAISAVVVTGVALAIGAWPLPPIYWLHVSAALIAIALNLYCVAQVVLRARADSAQEWLARTYRVQVSVIGVPFALVALFVGFAMTSH
ncbi:MAG: hypothetical protein U0904_04425 [Candidatus Nanopelagicales bacterium]|nr:hypothetical protein [Candidatus Nanopelagicales bacterium]